MKVLYKESDGTICVVKRSLGNLFEAERIAHKGNKQRDFFCSARYLEKL